MTLRASALVFAAALATTAAAAELGDISVRSYIGQQLAADIELVSLTPDDINGLQVRLAQQNVYQGANITMHPALAGVHMSVVRRDQRQFLHLTTLQAIEDDHLFLFLELSANGHHDVREATLWLQPDPHPAPPAAPLPVATAPSDAALAVARARANRPAPAARAAAPTAAPVPAAVPAPVAAAARAAEAVPQTVATEAKHEAPAVAAVVRKESGAPVAPKELAAAIAARLPSAKAAPKAERAAHAAPAAATAASASSAEGAATAAPLPLAVAKTPPLKGAAAPAACAPQSAGATAKECAALDSHNAALSTKLVELEGKLKVLQMALDGKAPAGKGHAAGGGGAVKAGAVATASAKDADPASAKAPAAQAAAGKGHASTIADTVKALAAADAALGLPQSEASASAHASLPAKPGKVLPKLKYKKEKPPEQGIKTSTLIAAGVGALALLGGLGWWLMKRRKVKGSEPLKIWQGWRKKKAAPDTAPEPAQPLHEVTPESLMESESPVQ